MKRSEMVEEVAILFGKYIDENASSTPRKMIDFILNEFEKKGMLPPYNNPFDRSLGEARTQVKYYFWEPENETK